MQMSTTENGNFIDVEGGLYVSAKDMLPANHSPADALIEEMRAQGECVTSPRFNAAQNGTQLPVWPRPKPAPGGAVIPPPTHPDMPDA